jgi:ring-1,2-phenylacetyl-CoA epoxidase subunit PaaD
MDVLRTIPDPEMPISIVDLGLIEAVEVNGAGTVSIVVLPTFVGCPALEMIEQDITRRVGGLDGVDDVDVSFVHDPPWSVDRITTAGRDSLREHGVTVPHATGPSAQTVDLRTSAVPCPFCSARDTRLDSAFGPTRCRMIYYCEACRNTFEHMKRV